MVGVLEVTIYILDNDLKKIAEALDDKSLNKMIKNIAQVLCNVHHKIGMDWLRTFDTDNKWENTQKFRSIPLTKTFLDAPGAWEDWARECKANYLYLGEFGRELIKEFNFRYDIPMLKKQECNNFYAIHWVSHNVPNLPYYFETEHTKEHWTFIISDGSVKDDIKTPFPLIMPKKYILDGFDPDDFDKEGDGQSLTIQSYRNYYRANKLKQNIQKWTRRQKPDWLI